MNKELGLEKVKLPCESARLRSPEFTARFKLWSAGVWGKIRGRIRGLVFCYQGRNKFGLSQTRMIAMTTKF